MASYYGRRVTGTDDAFATTGSGTSNQRTTVHGPAPEDGFLYKVGFRGGYTDNADPCDAYLAVSATAEGLPQELLGQVGPLTINSRMTSTSTGGTFEADLPAAIPIRKGSRYAFTLQGHNGRLSHGYTDDKVLLYKRNIAAGPVPDPIGYTSADPEGTMSSWGVYQPNTRPYVPSFLVPGDGAQFATATPTFESTFFDEDELLPNGLAGDHLAAYQVVVYRQSDQAKMWDSGWVLSSPAERAAGVASIVYAGTALASGSGYWWYTRHRDRCGAVSDFTQPISFTRAAGAVVTLDGAPSGQLKATSTSFAGKYSHAAGLAMTTVRVELRRLDTSAIAYWLSPDIAKAAVSSASPGTAFTVTWAETGFPALVRGGVYEYAMQAKDSAAVWHNMSAGRRFTVNLPPSDPEDLRPTSGQLFTSPPKLTCLASDPDDSPAPGGALQLTAWYAGIPAIGNPSADANTTNWTAPTQPAGITASLARDTTDYDTSPGSFRLDLTANSSGIATTTLSYYSVRQPIYEGEAVRVAFKAQKSGASVGSLAVGLYWYNEADTLLAFSTLGSAGATSWTAYSFTGTAPAGARFFRLYFYGNTLVGGTGSWWWDSITFNGPPSTLRGVAMAYNASTGLWEKQLGAGDLPSYIQSLSWWATATDGELTAPALFGVNTFGYVQGPVVTITAPTEAQVLVTSSTTITWTCPTQVSRRVRLYKAGTGELFYDSGTATTASLSHPILTGTMYEGNYVLLVECTDSLGVTAAAALRLFSVNMATPATPAGYFVSPHVCALDTEPTAVRMSWTPVTTSLSQFLYYRLYCYPTGSPSERRLLREELDRDASEFIYYLPPSGVQMTYELEHWLLQAPELLVSVPASGTCTIELTGAVICDAQNGASVRAVLRYARSRREALVLDQTEVQTWDGGPPHVYEGSGAYKVISGVFRIVSDSVATAQAYLAGVRSLAGRRPDGTPVVACYRDELGRKVFGRVKAPLIDDRRVQRAEVTLSMTEVEYTEGAS